ncbi:PIR protein [Plasmodium ovale]|uniref:PIR Superfamily Protein n=2 Tax=Plasmodium ovale TaxID=36330 RepID=A0A1A8X1P2_PLAOA|nr:PIR Superfamily Protein [Plasmodium ovale curtisi]SBS99176.1 PIR Superfamily Protein [Plasmodium ovale curtisi]SBT83618.1 PIR protein [Plasmodium ovale]
MESRTQVLKSELRSFDFHLKLNNSVTNCKHCSECDTVNERIRNIPWFKIFCYQFVRNVQTVYEIIHLSTQLREKRCSTLIYWIHDKVTNFYKKNNVEMKNVDIISELLKLWKNINSTKYKGQNYICQLPESQESLNLEEMKRKIVMSDYCEDYDTLKSLLTKRPGDNCSIYYDYFKDSLSKYEKIVKNCDASSFSISNCLRFCRKNDPEDLLNKSKCKLIEIWKDKEEYIEKEKCDALKDKAVAAVTCKSEENKITEFTFSDNRAIILILFSLWGIFLTFLFLYKMTPLRSWISNKLRKEKIIRDSFHEESDNESLDVDYENIDRNMEKAGYSISYNSDWNSIR